MLIVLTIYFKNHAIIKGGNNEINIMKISITIFYLLIYFYIIILCIIGGGFEFMIIILIGLLLNIVNAIVLTFKKTTFSCYQTYLFSNTVIKNYYKYNIIKSKRNNKIL